MMRFQALLVALAASVAQGQVTTLTEANYAQLTAGKTVFVKFYAPWCGHCKAMAPDWEKLADEWRDHKVGLIAQIDCVEEAQLCQDFEVEGYPTLYFGDPAAPETYEGARDYDAMATFAKENLSDLICSVYNTEACTDEEKAVIAELDGKSAEDLNTILAGVEKEAEEEETKFDKAVETLQDEYEKLVESYNDNVDKLRLDSNYQFLRAVVTKKEEKGKSEL
eukprot:CAMPEP_0119012640 /NCGR_PEP_ID=MMETSP1176-20130426/7111_1 /TAXON_ID=265551 /ORGANISM="Synedropsis recta cf, Strain CCMP1620" /LENGTH=221 /DNA_ID=CAMNT_0006965637 /DNA_START=48 /DNA_END=713 /DNA_ORIENTATION=+